MSSSPVRCPTPNPRVGRRQRKPWGRQRGKDRVEGVGVEKTQETDSRGGGVSDGEREQQRGIGGAEGTLRGQKGTFRGREGLGGRTGAATYPPGHGPAPPVLDSGGHGRGLIAAGGPRGPRRVPGSPSGRDPLIAAEDGGGSSARAGRACVTSGSSRGDA